LDFSKIEAGKLIIENVDFNILKVVEQISDLISDKIKEKNLKFQVMYCTDSVNNFYGDSLRIGQVLLNLLGNAIKFTHSGTINLNINRVSKNRYRFEIKDTGIGLTQEQQLNLFQSFNQADSSTTRKYGGTGLGLSISKQLVELMNGKIWVESVINEGSSFIFEISLLELEDISMIDSADLLTDTKKLLTNKDIYTLQGSNILLVEDNKINQEIVVGLLESSGINIDIANNGQEAVDMFNENDYELILMDLQMPIMGGIEATKIIRVIDIKIPIIALTANAMKEDIEKTKQVGMNEHLNKPIEIEKLYQVLLNYIITKVDIIDRIDIDISSDNIVMQSFKTINTKIGLELLLNNSKLYLRLLTKFYKDYHDLDFNSFEDEEYFRIIHTISGLSGNIGATSLHSIASQLDQTKDKSYFNEFSVQLKLVLNELKVLDIKDEEVSEDTIFLELTNSKRDELFEELKKQIKTNRPNRCEPVIQEINQYKLSKEDDKLFLNIKGLIGEYKFRDALELI
ncbi:MAG: response regulator, partial [Arcobacteraceae bacterium]|nr:response regulator [Arcobacteraceae bacterium]